MPLDKYSGFTAMKRVYVRFQKRLPTDSISNILYQIANVLLVLTTVALLSSILFRLFSVRIRGMQLLAQLFAVWMSLLIAGNLERDGKHIEVDYFVNKLSPTVRRYVDVFRLAVCIFSVSFIVYSALLAIQRFWNSTSPALNVPAPVLHAAPLIGMTFLAAIYVHQLVNILFTGDGVHD